MKDGYIFPEVEELTSFSHDDYHCHNQLPTLLDCQELLNFYLKNFLIFI